MVLEGTPPHLLVGCGILFGIEFLAGLWSYRKAEERAEMWQKGYARITNVTVQHTSKSRHTKIEYDFMSGGEYRTGTVVSHRAPSHYQVGGPLELLYDPSDFSKFMVAEENTKSKGIAIMVMATIQTIVVVGIALFLLKTTS